MFLGEFQHSLDTKGRVILPAKYRDQLAEGRVRDQGQGRLPVGVHAGGVREVATQIREQSKQGTKELNAARTFFGGASEIKPDKQGRVALPAEPARVRRPRARRRGGGPLLPHRDLGPRPLARARPGGRPGPDRLRRPARLRDLSARHATARRQAARQHPLTRRAFGPAISPPGGAAQAPLPPASLSSTRPGG